MKDIGYLENAANMKTDVERQEKELKGEYKKNQREINQKKEKDANDKKNAELQLRMERVYQKVGRVSMPRSMKKKVKREKAEVKVDEDTVDQHRYLGLLEAQQQ